MDCYLALRYKKVKNDGWYFIFIKYYLFYGILNAFWSGQKHDPPGLFSELGQV